MYFNQIPRFNFKAHFNTAAPFHAHLREDEHGNIKSELLEDHMDLTMSYFEKLCAEKNLDSIFHHFEIRTRWRFIRIRQNLVAGASL